MDSWVCSIYFENCLSSASHSDFKVPFQVCCSTMALVILYLSRLEVHVGFLAMMERYLLIQRALASFIVLFHCSWSCLLRSFMCCSDYWSFFFDPSLHFHLDTAYSHHLPSWTYPQHAGTSFKYWYFVEGPCLGTCFCGEFWLAQFYWKTKNQHLVIQLRTLPQWFLHLLIICFLHFLTLVHALKLH